MDLRPICVLPVVYRIWSSMRCRKVLAWIAEWAPPGIVEYLRSRECSDMVGAIGMDIELASATRTCAMGFVVDLVKAFERLGRAPVMETCRKLGMPEGLLGAWTSHLSLLRRRCRLGGGLGQEWQASTGFPEGCPHGCASHDCCEPGVRIRNSQEAPEDVPMGNGRQL